MVFSHHVRNKYPVAIFVIFKKLPLNVFPFSWFVFWYAHGNKTTCLVPPNRLIDTFIIFNPVVPPHLVPLEWIKGWIASLVTKYKQVPSFHCCFHTLPTDEFPITTKDYFLYTTGKIFLKTPNYLTNLLAPHRLSTA